MKLSLIFQYQAPFVTFSIFHSFILSLTNAAIINLKSERRLNINFLVKLKKFLTERFKVLNKVFDDKILCHVSVFKWHKPFSKDRYEVGDDEPSIRPVIARLKEKLKKN